MIFLNVKLDGLYGFYDFEMNLTFPRRVNKSIIGRETLLERPNFRYKKVVILTGASCTGKTALREAMLDFCVYLTTGDPQRIVAAADDKANFEFDFISEGYTLRRVSGNISGGVLTATYQEASITVKDCYETSVKRLKQPIPMEEAFTQIGKVEFYTGDEAQDPAEYEKYLSTFIRDLDLSIDEVNYRDGKVTAFRKGKEVKHLSDGTLQAIPCAHMMTSIMQHKNGFFYADAVCAKMKSETERAIFALMSGAMQRGEQLIYATYCPDILSLSFPKHSFMFLRRYQDEDTGVWKTAVATASEYLLRTTDSVYWAEKNDVFESQADDYVLDEIEYPWPEVLEGDLILEDE